MSSLKWTLLLLIVVMKMSYNALLAKSTNASVPGNDALRVTVRIRMREDFMCV